MAARRKRRTREHVIASQSVVHVEHFIVHAGYTAERVTNDYGFDLNMYTYDAVGYIENGNIYLQLKATDHMIVLQDGKTISFSLEWADIDYWRYETMPVILVVYDAISQEAYWLYIQEILENPAAPSIVRTSGKVTVHLSKDNLVKNSAIEQFRKLKESIQNQTSGNVRHYG